MAERELTETVSLTSGDGRVLNRDAVGWARSPLVDASRLTRRAWGRNKRWEYWNVTTPTHILALTISSLDYAAVHEVWVFDRVSQRTWGGSETAIPGGGAVLPPNLGWGPAQARAGSLRIDIEPSDLGRRTRLRASAGGAMSFDVTVARPDRHDCLAVVVPWSSRRFQYTVKDVALPAEGVLRIDGVEHEVPAGQSWAVLDHGRGRWPYDVRWNWGAGSGISDGRVIGVQLGGRWTDGTGSTENGILVDGHLHKISTNLRWDYDLGDPMQTWRVGGGGLDASFEPFYDKQSATNLGIVAGRTHQCFGHWSGRYAADGVDVEFAGILGWAEDVHNRW